MAIILDRIDGQNIGLRLTAPDVAADVLSVNLSTGAVTSAYLSTSDKQLARAAALELFSLVPYAERLTGALGFLQRLVAVTPADNSTLTLSAALVGDVATLTATIGAAPGNLIIHVPYSADGLVAWSAAASGGGGGGVASVAGAAPIASSGGANPTISLNNSGVVAGAYGSATSVPVVTVTAKGLVSSVVDTPITFPAPSGIITDTFTSGAAITAGQVVYLAADGFVYPAQSNAAATSSVVGVSTQTVGGGASVAVATFNNSGALFLGLTAGTEYFLSATAAGAVVPYATLALTSGAQIVSLGYARSATNIQLAVNRRGVTP